MAQSLSNLLIHLVFSTKARAPLIPYAIQNELYIYMKGIARSLNAPALEIGGMEDHVHILLVLPRTSMVSDVVKVIKQGSTNWLKKQESRFWDFSWQRGYGAFSVSFSAKQKVIEYIQQQKKLHENRSYEDEFRLILRMHEVSFDETYVWD